MGLDEKGALSAIDHFEPRGEEERATNLKEPQATRTRGILSACVWRRRNLSDGKRYVSGFN